MRRVTNLAGGWALVLLVGVGCRSHAAALSPVETYVARGEHREAGMLACRPGFAVAGFHEPANQLLCRRIVTGADTAHIESRVDGPAPTIRRDMHACPDGYYVRGVHVLENRLLCSRNGQAAAEGQPAAEQLEQAPGYQEAGMHACPSRTGGVAVVTGVQARRKQLLCSLLTP
jgi:hypothetical protein